MKLSVTINGETRQVSFTKPQARIMERLLSGKKVKVVGDRLTWYPIGGFDYEYVGCRAFNGAMWAIVDAFGMTSNQEHELYRMYLA